MPRCFLGLGGNVGDVAATFASVAAQFDGVAFPIRVVRTSSIYRTAPIGDKAGCEFLNAAAEVETKLSPAELLQQLQAVERSFGRKRDVHWGPRPLDIDLLLYGDEIIERPDLIVPHPALWYRRFVLDPLAEIAANVTYPTKRSATRQVAVTIWKLRQRLLIRPFRLRFGCPDGAHSDHLLHELRSRFPEVEFEVTAEKPPSDNATSEFVAWLNPPEPDLVRGPVVDGDMNSHRVTVPGNDGASLEFLCALISAATDKPVIVSGPIIPER